MKKIVCCLLFLLLVSLMGCGHTLTSKVGLMSFGHMEGKVIPATVEGKILTGQICGPHIFLSDAVRDALKDTDRDTMIDNEITMDTGLFVWSNCITVKGNAFNSKTLVEQGGKP